MSVADAAGGIRHRARVERTCVEPREARGACSAQVDTADGEVAEHDTVERVAGDLGAHDPQSRRGLAHLDVRDLAGRAVREHKAVPGRRVLTEHDRARDRAGRVERAVDGELHASDAAHFDASFNREHDARGDDGVVRQLVPGDPASVRDRPSDRACDVGGVGRAGGGGQDQEREDRWWSLRLWRTEDYLPVWG